jgi:hypothetical protein
MYFAPMKVLALGAALGFFQSALAMLREEDWGKLDFCEHAWILLKQIHLLIICLLGYVFIAAALFAVLSGMSLSLQPAYSVQPDFKYALLLLSGYLPSKILSWLTLFKPIRAPLSGIDSLVLKWREIFIENLRKELKLRLIKLHCSLHGSEQAMAEKLYPFFEQHKFYIANDLKFPKALRVHPEDYPLMTRTLMEWQGYYETARLIGKKGFLFHLRPLLCPLETLSLLGIILYALYLLGFFHI